MDEEDGDVNFDVDVRFGVGFGFGLGEGKFVGGVLEAGAVPVYCICIIKVSDDDAYEIADMEGVYMQEKRGGWGGGKWGGTGTVDPVSEILLRIILQHFFIDES